MFFPTNYVPPMPPMTHTPLTNPFSHMPTHIGHGMVANRASRGILGRLFSGFSGLAGLQQVPGQTINFMSMLENTQRVINIVQTVSPMVQQYGPIIRNIPQIYKILKDAQPNSTDNSDKTPEKKGDTYQEKTIEEKETNTQAKQLTNFTHIKKQTTPKLVNNIPAPKMYV